MKARRQARVTALQVLYEIDCANHAPATVLERQVATKQLSKAVETFSRHLVNGVIEHQSVLDLADRLPQVTEGKAFIFSTSSNLEPLSKVHGALREKLRSKGYVIVDEFTCAGFNTNSFIKLIGGINKGRPNAKDLKQAEEFAQNLKQKLQEK